VQRTALLLEVLSIVRERTYPTNTDKPIVAIVDDDESLGRALNRLVRELGMEAKTFLSGQDFLDVVGRTPFLTPDCLVLDLRMPGVSGFDVQEQLIRNGTSCPVIVMTAYADADVHQRATALGAIAVLAKPFDQDVFIGLLRTALGRRARRPPES
jgi:FixJ family two-component response regulator